MSVRSSLEEITIWIWEDFAHQCGWACIQSPRDWIEQIDRKRVNSWSLLQLEHPSVPPLDTRAPDNLDLDLFQWLPGSQFRFKLNYTTRLSGTLLEDSRSLDLLVSITMWPNYYNKSPLYIYLSICFSEEPWLIQKITVAEENNRDDW